MASFLKNHGDIILDAVLTDYGRKLLARGDGSFSIVKFALADDEIDYTLYDNSKPSTSKDSELMKTPIMEAITNNAASMKSPLLSIAMENILFMPSMKLKIGTNNKTGSFDTGQFNGYVVPVNFSNDASKLTYTFLTSSANFVIDGVLNTGNREIVVDNGIDSDRLSYEESMFNKFPLMNETQFNIYVDNRFCSVAKNIGGNVDVRLESLPPISVDDDSIAIYRVTNQTAIANNSLVTQIPLNKDVNETPIKGTRGSRISFTLNPSGDLSTTNTLFQKYGKIRKINDNSSQEFFTIRSSITVEGITTGCSVEVPIMFAKVKL